ncbi:MAG: LysM peptidoglycan-binding domain-containing protein [Oscillospiraceae bacterium]|nr:LysM peptidoglycan-binding domain-containing protein [Oscillospiraceae bacterium]
MEIYVVQQRDTAAGIAERFGISTERLISDNSLAGADMLTEGQALLILQPETVHTLKSGETLFSVAAQYGTSVMQLYRNNPYLIGAEYIPQGSQIVVSYTDSPSQNAETSGFAYSFINRAVLEAALPYLTYLIIFGYGFKDDGSIITLDDGDMIDLAHRYDTAVLLSLSAINVDGSFGSGKIERLLTDIPFQNEVIDSFIAVIQQKGAQGLDIDMEYIPPNLREEFAAFAENAAEKLRPLGLILHIDLAPKTSSVQQGTLYEAHDYALLGAAADYVFLMTYEWGYTFGPPMAVAPLPNVRRVLEYALTEIPKEKIFLGIPNYGYDWRLPFERGVTAAVTLGNLTAVNLAIEKRSEILFDEQSQSPYFYYTANDGSEHVVWFEDVRSLRGKFELVQEKAILGCGYWNLMRPFPQNFLLLNSMFNIVKTFSAENDRQTGNNVV